ncbi:MAG: 2'-5' RNA ligase [Candidatus Colwellbacteria bacterium RIFCSPHIGHO2_12_FULL_44_17]|uniref:RNA 2',3'-cyclic phosphodiesterase n=1 Tax=Candidatus Colwellbacteria bacterium RIFCSPHIGHO2_12_FULL_44_17 TaxID=1797689 RepID=A0A1G1Z3E7_9BACT|nr:MAG: 2'-5' RNA ligase [Candidatus Colwellbacteria bacterium RIFCSPHIGHO2_12_FULL_44_17]
MARVFVAVPISSELQKEILGWEGGFQKLPVRWLSGKNLHITLVPPWEERDPNEVARLLENLRGTLPQFSFLLEHVAYGPNSREPRLIWAEGKSPQSIIELKTAIEECLALPIDEKPFRLHLTLARFRPETFSSFPIKKLDERVMWEEYVTSFVLVESHLSPQGADYEVLYEVKL